MKSEIFQFKQFSVIQDNCAMKVNTDGVLLGSWPTGKDAELILDIGTGTGVIALMMAQKNPNAQIDAIDIDAEACHTAALNFSNSKWSERLHIYPTALQNFRSDKKYDLIISNPPYFMDDLKTNDHRQNIARHSTELNYNELLAGIKQLISIKGKAFLVIPAFNIPALEMAAESEKIFITAKTEVRSVEEKQAYIVLLRLETSQAPVLNDILCIQKSDGGFTEAYQKLTCDFYLKF